MKICIVIPVHNEEKAVGKVVASVRHKGFDVIVFDDGSDDRSKEAAGENGAHVIVNARRQGKGYSLKEGFRYALEQGYDGVITMDGDGQHDAGDLEQFLPLIRRDPASVIVGNRMEDTKEMPAIRRVTNKLMSGLISFICLTRIPDTQCGFRYIGADVLKKIKLRSNDFEIETEILVKASKNNFKIYSVPIKTIYEDEESKIRPFKDTFRFIVYLFRETFS